VEEKPLLLPGSLASGKNLSLEMLKAGWVTTYEQAGAEYGQLGKDEFLRVEAEAKYMLFQFPSV
jgi:endonuclease YncB( thermonuclease family)